MNVNELADEVEMWGRDLLALNMKGGVPVIEGAKLIRQQQAEIESLRMGFDGNGTSDSELAEVRAMANRWFLEIQALKQIIDANNLSQNIGQFVKPANEPVALVNNMCNDSIDWKVDPLKLEEGTPLYTHPAKTLTDEEIKAVYGEYFDVENCDWLHLQCIQAILRKAQGKP
jgi:hypothetical protein